MKNNPLAMVAIGIICSVWGSIAGATTQWNAQEYDLYPGDFNGDGRTDLLYVAKDPAGASGIALSDGASPNIGWQTWLSNHLGIPWHSNLYTVLVGDFNEDGRSDLFLQRSSPGDHYLLFANADGKFTALGQTLHNNHLGSTLILSQDQHKAHVGDFDGDGRTDLFLQATVRAGTHGVILADANGQFPTVSQQSWTQSQWGAFQWSTRDSNIVVGDFNGDHFSDLLVQAKPNFVMIDFDVPFPVPTYAANAFGVARSLGGTQLFQQSGIRQWNRNHFGADWSPTAGSPVVGDFDGNGTTDVLLQARNSGRSSYLLSGNTGEPAFAAATAAAANVSWSADGFRLTAGNFDGSGGSGLYWQAQGAGGANYYSNAVAGGSVSLTTHSAVQPGGIVPATVVGRTPGAFSVSNVGAATYDVALWMPPGPRGMQPNLALSYNSGAGNGVLGVGWSLSGLSSIERCNRTVGQDGQAGGVMLALTDRFCLNGKRLQLISGNNAVAGSQYRLEIDDFSTVTAMGSQGAGPAYFVLRDRTGVTFEYGNSVDSSVPPFGSTIPFRWKLNKVVDQYGNSYIVSYSNVDGHAVPTTISWAPTSAGGSSYQYTATFTYINTRTQEDSTSGYVANLPVANNRRLEAIKIQSSTSGVTQTVRKYAFSYDIGPTTKRSRLTGIQECADDSGSACLSPTSIAYQNGQGINASAIPGVNTSINLSTAQRDFNGDGRDDLLYVVGSNWHVAFATEGGFSVPRDTGVPSSTTMIADRFVRTSQDGLLAAVGGVWRYYAWNESTTSFTNTSTGIAVPTVLAVTVADMNGDGLAELVWAITGNQIYIRRNITAQGATVPAFDASATLAATVPTNRGTILAFRTGESQGVRRYDFEGDGRQDLIAMSLANVPGPNPERYFSTALLARDTTFDIGASPPPLMVGGFIAGGISFNDDACTDRLLQNTVYIEKCGTTAAGTVTLPVTPTLLMDWDGDGRTDFLAASGGTFVVYRSLGNSVGAAEATSIPYSAARYFAIDQDGDGLEDIVRVATTSPYGLTFYSRIASGSSLAFDVATPDLAVGFTDGFGVTYSPGYVSTARKNYSSLNNPDADLQVMTGATTVVAQVTAANGAGGTYNRTYEYSNARTSPKRNEFAGFEIVKEIDARTNLVRKTTYQLLFPLTGLVKKSELLQTNGTTPIQVASYEYQSHGYTFGGAHPRYFPFVDQVISDRYEFGGIFNAQLLYTATTNNDFDSATGALTDSVTTVVEGSGANGLQNGVTHRSEVHYTLFNDVGNSCLGLPQTIRETRSNTIPISGASVLRSTDIDWNGNFCRPNYSVVEPNSTRWKVTTSFGYDSFGNVNSMTETPVVVAGQNQAPRTTSINWGTTGQFPTVVTNPLSQQTKYGWNKALGAMISATDANNISTYWYPDVFGRVMQESRPDGTHTEQTLTACNAGNSYCAGASDLRLKIQNQAFDSGGALIRADSQYFDRFEKLRYNDQQLLTGVTSRAITTYDSLGRRQTQSVPHTSGGPLGNTTYGYDLIGRMTSVQRQVSETDLSTPAITIGYLGMRREVTDSRASPSQISATVVDSLGRVIQAIDAAQSDTEYEYDAFGNLLNVTDVANNPPASFSYNQLGWKLTSNDPDMGHWEYDYYPLGELRWQKDANLREVTFQYDALSRLTSRQELEGTTNFYFDAAAHGIGQLGSVTAPGGYAESFAYDIAGRLAQRTVAITEQSVTNNFSYVYDYNAAGLLDTLTYPVSTSGAPFKVQYAYQYGINNSVRSYVSNSPGTVYWQATNNVMSPSGQYTDEQLGNGLRTRSTYDLVSGLIKDRKTGPGVTQSVQNLSFTYYRTGQLETRNDANRALSEKFFYDSLNRLDRAELNTVQNLNVDYDAIGNIMLKTGVGDYHYDATKKHAVRSITVNNVPTHTYDYDFNGNMTQRDGATTTWFSYNLPKKIDSSSASSEFSYTHDRQRWKQQVNNSGSLETVTYIGDLLERRVVGGDTEYRHLIVGGNGPVGYVERASGTSSTTSTYYVSTDHLGGTSVITNDSGIVLVNQSFDAFGQRRGSNWTGAPTAPEMAQIATTTRRGFTFHEHLDNLNLVHMNGRVYDSALGRFTSADPFVQSPFNGQSLNRYSYGFNDPLNTIDPSGFACFAMPSFNFGFGSGSDPDDWGSGGGFSFDIVCDDINAPGAFAEPTRGDLRDATARGDGSRNLRVDPILCSKLGDCTQRAPAPLGQTVGNYIFVAGLYTGVSEIPALASLVRGIASRAVATESGTLLGRSVGAAFNVSATPAGRQLTTHAIESLERHGFKSLDKVDDIIANATQRMSQADGAAVFVQQMGRGGRATFNVIVDGSEGIVTGMLNLTRQEIRALAQNYGWTGAL